MVQHLKPQGRRPRVAMLVAFLVFALAAGLYWFQPWRLWTNTTVDDALPVLAADISAQSAAVVPPAHTGAPVAISVGTPVVPTAVPRSAVVATSTATARATRGAVEVVTTPSTPQLSSGASASGTPKTSAPVAPSIAATAPAVSPTASTGHSAPEAISLATGRLITHEHETSGTVQIVRLADGRRVLTLENLRTSDGPALHVWVTDAPVLAGEAGWKVFDDGRHVDLGDLKGNLGNQVYPLPADLDLDGYTSVSIWCERFSVSFGAAELHPA